MNIRFRFRPIQPELKHLVLGYNETTDEYNLINLQHNVFAGDFKTVFYEKYLPDINLENYEKERHYRKEERERMEMLKLMEQLYHVSDRRVIRQEIYKLSKEDLEDFAHLMFRYTGSKPCTDTITAITFERMNELNENR